MSKRDIIYIPEDAAEIPITYFPTSNNLQNFLRKSQIKLVSDLQTFSQETIEEILYNRKKPYSELKQLIIAIQESDLEQMILIKEEIPLELKNEIKNFLSEGKIVEDVINKAESLKLVIEEGNVFDKNEIEYSIAFGKSVDTINDLLKFINVYVSGLEDKDKIIFCGRLGATRDEEVKSMAQICKECKVSLEFIATTVLALVNEIKVDLDQCEYNVLEELYNNCLETICPLTPQFLIYLTKNDYDLFLYPPTFYVRLIGLLSPQIPILLKYENKIKKIGKDAKKITKRIKELLQYETSPVPLIAVFNRLNLSNNGEKNLTNVFFEAIQSPKFNLIKGDKPNELFIELGETKLV